MSAAGSEHVRAEARRAAAQRLEKAATLAAMDCTGPLFRKKVKRPGGGWEVISLEWPGVLRVYDAATGEVLAESEPGRPATLRGAP